MLTEREARLRASVAPGYGLADLKDSFTAQLEKALKGKGHNAILIQGGISGDTTTGGLRLTTTGRLVRGRA